MTSRQLICEAVKARLEGYAWTTVQPKEVHIGRDMFAGDMGDTFPLATVLPGDESGQQTQYSNHDVELPISVAVLISLDDLRETYEICEPVLGELKKILFTTPLTVVEGGTSHLISLGYNGASVGYKGALGADVVPVQVNCTVEYTETYTSTEE